MNGNENITNEVKKKKTPGILIPILLVVLLIIVLEVIYYVVLSKPKTNDNKKEEETEEKIDYSPYLNTTKDITRNGKKTDIYKYSYLEYEAESYDIYSTDYSPTEYKSEKVGTVTCITNNCEFYSAYDKYAIFMEDNHYYLYDYNKDKLVVGPMGNIDVNNPYDNQFSAIFDGNQLYGLEYQEDNHLELYYLKENLYFKEFEKLFSNSSFGLMDNYLLKYGYVSTFTNDEKYGNIYDITHLKTSYTFENTDISFIEGDNAVYMIKYGDQDDNTGIGLQTIYDLNGNKLFDGQKFYDICYTKNNEFITYNGTKFTVYDSKFNKVRTSKDYTKILMIGDDFVVALEGTKLELINSKDELLTTFVTDYNEKRYYLHDALSGWYTDNGKNGIYIVLQDSKTTVAEVVKDNPDMQADDLEGYDLGYEYYYIPTTKETGRIATYIGGYAKPVLYLYPEKETKVTITFEHKDNLTTTYPKFNNNWSVLAYPNGNLIDNKGRQYYALYWEENSNHLTNFNEGFYVTKDNAINFLEEKLSIIGLNERESNEFIMYWLPILERNEKSLVYFELTEERDSYNKLLISPKPDSILRLAMHVKKVDKEVKIKPQTLTPFKRQGFTAIEWGGINY